MKYKQLALAAALAMAGAAHADLNTYTEAGPGSIALSLVNTAATTSALFDLGIDTSSFVDGAFSAPGTVITWDLATNTVGGNTALAGAITGDWNEAWDAYKSLAVVGVSTSRFGVWGGDRDLNGNDGFGTGRRLVTTSVANNYTMTNVQLTNALTGSQENYFNASSLLGTHVTADNGANVAPSGTPAYEDQAGGPRQNFGGNAGNINPTQQIGNAAYFSWVRANGTSTTTQTTRTYFGQPALDADLDGLKDYARFTFDASNGVLTYAVPAAVIPEPGTYALLLAGISVVGFVARRRRAR